MLKKYMGPKTLPLRAVQKRFRNEGPKKCFTTWNRYVRLWKQFIYETKRHYKRLSTEVSFSIFVQLRVQNL